MLFRDSWCVHSANVGRAGSRAYQVREGCHLQHIINGKEQVHSLGFCDHRCFKQFWCEPAVWGNLKNSYAHFKEKIKIR